MGNVELWFQIREQIFAKKQLIYVIGFTIFVEESNTAWVEMCITPGISKYRPPSVSTVSQCYILK